MKKFLISVSLILLLLFIAYQLRGMFWSIEKRSELINESFNEQVKHCDEVVQINQYFTRFKMDLGAITWICREGEAYHSYEYGLDANGKISVSAYGYGPSEIPALLDKLNKIKEVKQSVPE